MDENLSWRKRIVTVATKISKAIGMLSKLRHFLPSSDPVNIYNALIVNTLLNLWSCLLGKRLKRISTKYLSFKNVHYA